MKKLDKFYLFSGVLGTLASLITLVGFISGLVVPQPSWGFFGDPFVIAILTLTLLVYSLLVLMFFVILSAKRRWERLSRIPDSRTVATAPEAIGNLIGIPAFLIWGIAMAKLFWNASHASFTLGEGRLTDESFTAFIIALITFFYFIFVPLFIGSSLSHTAVTLVMFFEPGQDKE